MRRTQLYLDEDLWGTLHARARRRRTTVSQLVREAIRQRYLPEHGQRMKAMQALVGIRQRDSKTPDAMDMMRSLRRGGRLERLAAR